MEWVHCSAEQKSNWIILLTRGLYLSLIHIVCIGWKKEDKPELYAILNNIKIGDIIYIKALPLSSKTMRIKAVGIVTTALKTENTHHGYEECGNEIGIKWLKSNINKSINIDNSNINKRKGSLFVETNTDYIDKIISLI